ncbi:MAG: hypothetical protein ABR910_10405 [Acidobacteriaceae bacterium]|jgi:hypothetical protein
MASPIEPMNPFSGKTDKKLWKSPAVETLPIHGALGASVGSKCDRYGSLSKGTGCP